LKSLCYDAQSEKHHIKNQMLNIATTYSGLVHMGTGQWTGL